MAILDVKYNSLEGQILVSTPFIAENSIFFKSIIYIVSHTNEGAIGIILNHPITQIDSSFIFSSFKIDSNKNEKFITLHLGGPTEAAKGFILHSNDYNKDTIFDVDHTICLSSNIQILEDIAKGEGPKKTIFALGYSSWEENQLESEIYNNHWLTMPYNEDLVFCSENTQKWNDAYKYIGVNHNFYSIYSGNS